MYNNISIQTTLLVDILWIACVRGLCAVRAGTRGSARQSSGVCERELPVCVCSAERSERTDLGAPGCSQEGDGGSSGWSNHDDGQPPAPQHHPAACLQPRC